MAFEWFDSQFRGSSHRKTHQKTIKTSYQYLRSYVSSRCGSNWLTAPRAAVAVCLAPYYLCHMSCAATRVVPFKWNTCCPILGIMQSSADSKLRGASRISRVIRMTPLIVSATKCIGHKGSCPLRTCVSWIQSNHWNYTTNLPVSYTHLTLPTILLV